MIPKDWRQTVNRLKAMEPKPPLPVSVRTAKKLDGCLACCWKEKHRFVIVVEQGCRDCMYQSLVHEFAHLYDWHDGIKEHSESWGCWYARAYQVVFETD